MPPMPPWVKPMAIFPAPRNHADTPQQCSSRVHPTSTPLAGSSLRTASVVLTTLFDVGMLLIGTGPNNCSSLMLLAMKFCR